MVAEQEKHLGSRMGHVKMGDTGICMLKAAISEEGTDKAE